MSQWQSVETAPTQKEVLVFVVNPTHNTQSIQIASLDSYGWRAPCGAEVEIYDYKITHWMPLPEPPNAKS